jgi:hypothetical protein
LLAPPVIEHSDLAFRQLGSHFERNGQLCHELLDRAAFQVSFALPVMVATDHESTGAREELAE